MGRKWVYRLKKEDFANVAQRLNVALDGRLEDMRKALSEYYSETDNDPQLIGPEMSPHAFAYQDDIGSLAGRTQGQPNGSVPMAKGGKSEVKPGEVQIFQERAAP